MAKNTFQGPGDAAKVLRISPNQLVNLYPYLVRISIRQSTRRSTHLLSVEYVRAYRDYLKKNKGKERRATIATASAFALEYQAMKIAERVRGEFDSLIKAQGAFTSEEISELLTVPHTTVLGWMYRKVIKNTKQINSKGEKYIVHQRDLVSAITWNIP